MECRSVARTDRGLRRPRNEDALLDRADVGVFAVADGMGGHAAGDVASRVAIEVVESACANRPHDAEATARWLADTLRRANRTVHHRGMDAAETEGMGTTLTVLATAASGHAFVIGHVGDSRVYRLREGEFRRLTVDHTWVEQQVERGLLTPAQARRHPFGNVLTRGIGGADDVEVDVATGEIEPGDLFLLCSDGLTAHLDDDDLAALLGDDRPLAELADRAVDETKRRGGSDNITLVLVRATA